MEQISICDLVIAHETLCVINEELSNPENDKATLVRLLNHEELFSNATGDTVLSIVENSLSSITQKVARWQATQRKRARNNRVSDTRNRRRENKAIGTCFLEDVGFNNLIDISSSVDWGSEAGEKLAQKKVTCIPCDVFSERLERLTNYAVKLLDCRPGSVVANDSSIEEYVKVLTDAMDTYNCRDCFDGVPRPDTTVECDVVWNKLVVRTSLKASGWTNRVNIDRFCHLGARLNNIIHDLADSVELSAAKLTTKNKEDQGDKTKHFVCFWSVACGLYNVMYNGELLQQIETNVLVPVTGVFPVEKDK